VAVVALNQSLAVIYYTSCKRHLASTKHIHFSFSFRCVGRLLGAKCFESICTRGAAPKHINSNNNNMLCLSHLSVSGHSALAKLPPNLLYGPVRRYCNTAHRLYSCTTFVEVDNPAAGQLLIAICVICANTRYHSEHICALVGSCA
jgi:hypothetical protein